jgi:hypothetical protein
LGVELRVEFDVEVMGDLGFEKRGKLDVELSRVKGRVGC